MKLLNDEHNRELAKELNKMRQDSYRAALWAVIRGRGGTSRIALMLGWPLKTTRQCLTRLMDEGILKYKEENDTWSLDAEHDDNKHLEELKRFNVELEIETLEDHLAKHPSSKIEDGYLAAASRKGLAVRKIVPPSSKTYLINSNQFSRLELIRSSFGQRVFSTREYLTAREQIKVLYAGNELRALTNKGLVAYQDQNGSSEYWQLTPFGVEYKHEPMSLAEKKTRTITADRAPERTYNSAMGQTMLLLKSSAGGMTTQELAEARGVSRSAIHKQLTRYMDTGRVVREQMSDGSNRWVYVE